MRKLSDLIVSIAEKEEEEAFPPILPPVFARLQAQKDYLVEEIKALDPDFSERRKIQASSPSGSLSVVEEFEKTLSELDLPANVQEEPTRLSSNSRVRRWAPNLAVLGAILSVFLASKEKAPAPEAAPATVTAHASSSTPAPEAAPAPATASPAAQTLWERVSTQVAQDSTLTPHQKASVEASATNELNASLYSGDSWQVLQGEWQEDAYPLVLNKLETWGGYQDVLDSLEKAPASVDTISEALAHLVDDPNIADGTARLLAENIASIQDPRISADAEKAQNRAASVPQEKIQEKVADLKQNPPPSPAHFDYPADQVGPADLYDAPDAQGTKAPINLHELHSFQKGPRFGSLSTPEEMGLTSDQDAPTPQFVAPFTAAEEEFFKQGDAMNAAAEVAKAMPAPEPKPSFFGKAKAALSSITSWGKRLFA
jgi:hypothetical protein